MHLTNIATGFDRIFHSAYADGPSPLARVDLMGGHRGAVLVHRAERYFRTQRAILSSVVLMVTGAAALLPWESRWQLSLNCVALAMMVVQTVRVPDVGLKFIG